MSFDYITDQSHETMQALVTTEGMLFQDESVKKFYLIIKYYTFEIFENIFNIYVNDLNEYLNILQTYETFIDLESLTNKYAGIENDLSEIVILYTKYIFKKDLIRLKRPNLQAFLKGFFHKFIQYKTVKNGLFFESSMIEQDFIFRDIFRQTLFLDCIKIIERKVSVPYAPSVLPAYSVLSSHSKFTNTRKEVDIFEAPILVKKQIEIPTFKEIKESEKEEEFADDSSVQSKKSEIKKELHLQEEIKEIKIEKKEEDTPSLILQKRIEEEKGNSVLQKEEIKEDLELSEEEITEDDSISRVMEKMYIDSIKTSTTNQPKKIKKILL